ncbi:MAG: hypothetical protein ABFD89_05305 [Bryobacteraceae bacterium]
MQASQEITLATIEQSAKQFAADRAELASEVQTLEAQIQALKQAALARIKRRVAKAAESQSALSNLIDGARHLFIKPRTIVMHGIKLGLQKGRGGISWEDDARLVNRIKQLFSKSQAELLIKTTERPIAKALEDLDASDLKKLGVTIEATGDVVVIKPVDGDVDKLVSALLKDAVEEAAQQAA